MVAQNLLFYSTNTEIAYRINENYYNGKHYVWCSPVFNPSILDRYSTYSKIPRSSNPHEIYCDLRKDVIQGDRDSPKIKLNKLGLKKGASAQLRRGVITQEQFGSITDLIKRATIKDFSPYIYLIRADLVAPARIEQVSVNKTANPLGIEFRIMDLDRSEFEIIEVGI